VFAAPIYIREKRIPQQQNPLCFFVNSRYLNALISDNTLQKINQIILNRINALLSQTTLLEDKFTSQNTKDKLKLKLIKMIFPPFKKTLQRKKINYNTHSNLSSFFLSELNKILLNMDINKILTESNHLFQLHDEIHNSLMTTITSTNLKFEQALFANRDHQPDIELIRQEQQNAAIQFIKHEFTFIANYKDYEKMLATIQVYRKLNYTMNYGETIKNYITQETTRLYNEHILSLIIPSEIQTLMQKIHNNLSHNLTLNEKLITHCYNQKLFCNQLSKTPYLIDLTRNKKITCLVDLVDNKKTELNALSRKQKLNILQRSLTQRIPTEGIPTTLLSREQLRRLHLMTIEKTKKSARQTILILLPNAPEEERNKLIQANFLQTTRSFEDLALDKNLTNTTPRLKQAAQEKLLKNALYTTNLETLYHYLKTHNIHNLSDLLKTPKDMTQNIVKLYLQDQISTPTKQETEQITRRLIKAAENYLKDAEKRQSIQFKQCDPDNIHDLIQYGIHFEEHIHNCMKNLTQDEHNQNITSKHQLLQLSLKPNLPPYNRLLFATNLIFHHLKEQLINLQELINQQIHTKNTFSTELDNSIKKLIAAWHNSITTTQTISKEIDKIKFILDNTKDRLSFFPELKKEACSRLKRIHRPENIHIERQIQRMYRHNSPQKNFQSEQIHTFNSPYI
jgi:hypothetical protein